MNRNLIKACDFILKNRIMDEDLTVDLENKLLKYKAWSWDLTLDTIVEIEKNIFDTESLIVEDCDGYKIKVYSSGKIEVEVPEEDEKGYWLYSEEEAISEIDRILEVNDGLAKKVEMLEEENKKLREENGLLSFKLGYKETLERIIKRRVSIM